MQAPSDTLFQARTSPARIAQPPRSLDPSHPQPRGAPTGDRRGNATVTVAALLLALSL
jgi:hypothetical protein